jgi:integrase
MASTTLHLAVPKIPQPQPRETVSTDAEREAILAGAQPAFRFFLLLCGDLGLRHRTALRIAPANYRPEEKAISFVTKGNVQQILPVTPAIAEVFEQLNGSDPNTPVVNLLRGHRPGSQPGPRLRFTKQWNTLKKKLGIRPDLRIHDFRRAVAEDVWDATGDLRAVQAQLGHRSIATTARYLANRVQLAQLKPVLANVVALRQRRQQRTP